MGWIGNVQCAARHLAWPDALQHLLATSAASQCYAVPRRRHAGSKVTHANAERRFWPSDGYSEIMLLLFAAGLYDFGMDFYD